MTASTGRLFITAWAVVDIGVTNNWSVVDIGVTNNWSVVDIAA